MEEISKELNAEIVKSVAEYEAALNAMTDQELDGEHFRRFNRGILVGYPPPHRENAIDRLVLQRNNDIRTGAKS
ncbi:hypothetical protein [Anatilimnocola floriformis]|uniref:hypothetical protein n=1 Tax=Anatilimnocola floriformis TaxID=2948575 RepID=UPI0020C3CF5E|nr:hypothetical protein [Anatilimnocola floriformis]